MSKYKVGDRVRLRRDLKIDERYGRCSWTWAMNPNLGKVVTVKYVDQEGDYKLDDVFDHWYSDEMIQGLAEGQRSERRTFKQLTPSIHVKKDALWQKACDDGTQEYVLLDESFNKDPRQTQRIYDWSLVEEDTRNFVEVFKVHPEYMIREELDEWEAFKKKLADK